ncbi:hypothetical protein [Alteromonas oceanisediminis]|uniref:hypothetical protein n=1 Tax=Alteromonas oceanisediminis TaxID=2836180 RepID=UPI001BDB656A|nr:hypothetical protein [Alteromonas oceanisediminis]MBT0587973.1 hypothetical protein [Alteromonas oceanisediminis]
MSRMMNEIEGVYFWARVKSETDKILIVEQVRIGFYLMATDKLYPREAVELLSLPIPSPFNVA